MKFKNYLEHISGIGLYPLLSLIIFFAFFSLLTYWAVKARKDYISDMKQLPFNDKETAHSEL